MSVQPWQHWQKRSIIFCLSKQIIHQFVLLWHISIPKRCTTLCCRLSWTHFPICYTPSHATTRIKWLQANVPLGVKLIKSRNNVHLSSSRKKDQQRRGKVEIYSPELLQQSQFSLRSLGTTNDGMSNDRPLAWSTQQQRHCRAMVELCKMYQKRLMKMSSERVENSLQHFLIKKRRWGRREHQQFNVIVHHFTSHAAAAAACLWQSPVHTE